MEVCTYQFVACSTTMWGEEDSLLFIHMRVALGNGRTDAALVVCYVRRTPSELPSARDGQPADLTYIHDLGLAGRKRASERERHTVHMHLRTRRSFQPLIHSQNTSSSSKCRKQQAFFPYHYPRIVSYLSSGDGKGQIGGKIRKEIYRYSFG